MTFEEAMQQLREGRKVRCTTWPRQEWIDIEDRPYLVDVHISGLLYGDWEVVK